MNSCVGISSKSSIFNSIRKYVESYHYMLNNYYSDKTILHSVLDIDIDKSEDILCFRSESRDEDNIGKSGYSEMGILDSMVEFNKPMEEYLIEALCGCRDAINNTKGHNNKIKSYSKTLCIPLFKYTDNNPKLTIKKMRLNSLAVVILIERFMWVADSDTDDHSCIEYETMQLDVNCLNNIELMRNTIIENLELDRYTDDMQYHIDNISMALLGYTIDVSKVNKSRINELLDKYGEKSKIAQWKSFKADYEIISYNDYFEEYTIDNTDIIEMLRFMVLLRLGDRKDAIKSLYNAFMNNELYMDISIDSPEIEAVKIAYNYILNNNFVYEIDAWFSTLEANKANIFYVNWHSFKETLLEHIQKIRENSNLLSNSRLYAQMMQVSNLNSTL